MAASRWRACHSNPQVTKTRSRSRLLRLSLWPGGRFRHNWYRRLRRFCPNMDSRKKTSALLRSEEHTSELQSQSNLVCRLLLEKKKKKKKQTLTHNIKYKRLCIRQTL